MGCCVVEVVEALIVVVEVVSRRTRFAFSVGARSGFAFREVPPTFTVKVKGKEQEPIYQADGKQCQHLKSNKIPNWFFINLEEGDSLQQ
jgi:hypothetical protein